ncbi:MAG TPA: hypothetical protein VGK48_21420 [Terriglobia bacterium]
MSVPNNPDNSGFTLIEVSIASLILISALLGVGLLITKMTLGASTSKDMSSAAVLLSEKIEDLNRWDVDDPHICVPAGHANAGSLTADITQTTTCSQGASASISYDDDVYPNLTDGSNVCPDPSAGCFAETVSSMVGGNPVYTTTVHSPNGILQTTSSSSPPTGATFHRRWIIEADSPITGVRRVTVTISNPTATPPVSFQMTAVRP